MHICFKCKEQVGLVGDAFGGIPFNFDYPVHEHAIELIAFKARDRRSFGFSSPNKRRIIFHIWNSR